MKQTFLILLFFGSITYSLSQELNNQQIESDLYNTYQKIMPLRDADYGQLAFVNNNFKDKIKKYTSTYPSMLSSNFDSLRSDRNILIVNSEDQLMKIYSWNTMMGGSRPFYATIFQYKVGAQVFSKLAYNQPYTLDGEYNDKNFENFPFYTQIFTLEANNKIYYLGFNIRKDSNKDLTESIKIFTIENNKLNDSVALIKTKTGLVNSISSQSSVKYDSSQKIISLPTLNSKGDLSGKITRYKFTGQYFELLETPKNDEPNEVGIGFVSKKNIEFTIMNNDHIFSDPQLTEKWNSGEVLPLLDQYKSNIYHFICLEETENYYKILVNSTDIAYVPTAKINVVYKQDEGNGKTVDVPMDGSYYFATWADILSNSQVSRLTKDNPIVKDLNDKNHIIEYNCKYDFFFVNDMYRSKNGVYWLKISFSPTCEEYEGEGTKMVQGWIKWRTDNKLLIALSFDHLQC